MTKKAITGWLALILAVGGSGFWIFQTVTKGQQPELNTLYETVTVSREDLSDTVDTTGTLSFSQNGELYPAYEATVTQINRRVGDRVKKGEVLMVLDSSNLKTQWMEAQNTYQKAVANLKLAQKTLERNKILYQGQATTIDELEKAQTSVETYRQDVSLAEYNLAKLQKNPDGVNFLSSDRSRLWIKAPFDGVIAWIDVKAGETVKATSSNSTATSTLLLTMAADNSVVVTANVDESEIDKVKPGLSATVTLNDKQATELTGEVTAVGKIGTTDSDVVVFPVEIKVALPPVKVNSGMTADVTIQIQSRPNRLAIPAKAVTNRRGSNMVRVAQGNEVRYIPVTLGETSETQVEVLSGLQEGSQILVEKTTTSSNTKSKREQGPMGGGPMGGPPPMGR